MTRKIVHLLGCLSLFCLFMQSHAAINAHDKKLHLSIAPYVWLSGIQGDLTVGNRSVHASSSFVKMLKDLQFAAELHTEANYDRYTLMVDPIYLKLAMDSHAFDGKQTLHTQVWLIDSGVFYEIFAQHYPRPLSLELLGGMRYYELANQLTLRNSGRNFFARTVLFAPIVGGRIKYDFSPQWHGIFRADYGGFNVDHVRRTFSSMLTFSYTVRPGIDLGIAYRVLGLRYTQGITETDTLLYGPVLGAAFYW